MATKQPDLFDLYFQYVKDTEAPMVYHRWSLLSALATNLGRNCWLPFGTSRIFPNLYVMLVGNPGARKSSAIKSVKRVLASTGFDKFSAEKTSKEKFLVDLQGEAGAEQTEVITNLFGGSPGVGDPREVFICADEFNEFTGSGNIEFLSMLGALWDWDEPEIPYKHRLKTAKSTSIYQPTLNILSGNTHAGLSEAFPVQVIGQGFMSRLILVYSEPTGRKITIPAVPSAALASDLTRELLSIKACMSGELTFTRDAYSAVDIIYKTWPDLEDTRFKHYSTRRLTHFLKLCILVAAIGKTQEITQAHVLHANTILSYAELHMSKAIGEIGRKRGSDISSSVMGALYETREPLTMAKLFTMFETDIDSIQDLARILQSLTQAEKIQQVPMNGTREKGFLPKQRRISANKHLYVDMNLLKGVELK